MKKTAALVLAAMLALTFPTACRNKNEPLPSDLPVLSDPLENAEITFDAGLTEQPETQRPDETAENAMEAEHIPAGDQGEEETAPRGPEPSPDPPGPEGPFLLFEDNFEGEELDLSKWERCPEWERGGGACVWDSSCSRLDGEGCLILHAEYDDEGVVRSGAVRTAGRFSGGYGYYEASICFPKARGTWGAFWIMAGDLNSASAAGGVEIDIIESINNESGLCNHALHWNYSDLHSVSSGQMKKNIYDGKFHTFGLERTEDGYVFYIDGKRTWRASKNQCAPCPADGYLKLTVEAAEWAGAGTLDSLSDLPADMIVDYVRVYSEKP